MLGIGAYVLTKIISLVLFTCGFLAITLSDVTSVYRKVFDVVNFEFWESIIIYLLKNLCDVLFALLTILS